mmetsp:Transcript_27301/g.79946  ORF Transcript_27301/g.79946 Transcript_27301/m.79946 type:complete len:272 (-) Transcript_27301:2-817(-)
MSKSSRRAEVRAVRSRRVYSCGSAGSGGSDRRYLLLFLRDDRVDLRLRRLHRFLDLILPVLALVLAQTVLGQLLDLIKGRLAHIANCDLALLPERARRLCQLRSPVGRELRHVQSDHPAVVVRRHPEVRHHQRLLDVANPRFVVRVDHELRRRRRAHRGELVERRRRVVVVDHHAIEERRAGAAHTERRELLAHVADRLLHFVLRLHDRLHRELGLVDILLLHSERATCPTSDERRSARQRWRRSHAERGDQQERRREQQVRHALHHHTTI